MATTRTLVLCTALLGLLVMTVGAAPAAQTPPAHSGAGTVQPVPRPFGSADALPGLVGDLAGSRTITLCDQYAITYTLTFSGGAITGSAVGANACGNGGAWPVTGSYTRDGHVTFTVTNPGLCMFQFFTYDGWADRASRSLTGTYDWNGDGIDGNLTLTRCR